MESGAPADVKLPGQVYLLRGLTSIYSFGIDQLAAKISHRGVTAVVYGLTETDKLADDIIRKYRSGEDRGPVMLLGHSSGADRAITVAQKLNEANVPVALIVGLDPTRTADAVPASVELFINLYQGSNLIGGGAAKPAADFRGRLIDVDLRQHTEIFHITLDKTTAVQDAVVEKIIAVAAFAARQAKRPPPRHPQASAGPRPLLLKYTVPREAPIILWDDAVRVKLKSGDTLESIASSYDVPSWAVAQINGIEPDHPIGPGGTLIVPRIVYSDTRPPTAPPSAARGTAQAVARTSTKPPPSRDQAPAAVPEATEASPEQGAGSFGDRWTPAAAQ